MYYILTTNQSLCINQLLVICIETMLALILALMVQLGTSSDVDVIASRFVAGISQIQYSLHTADTHHTMDCLKISYDNDFNVFGIFHAVNAATRFSELYYSELVGTQWKNTVKLSDRGSQGTVVRVYSKGNPVGYLVGYQLENPNGNKIAIRFYENQSKIKANNFLYEYQLNDVISSKTVRNVGTVSLEELYLLEEKPQNIFNEYRLNIRFHYSPDGSHDFPGTGYVFLRPLRDFVDKSGKWIGGCYENYKDWLGLADSVAEGALRQAGCLGKIGQRDYFYLSSEKYYIYECNLDSSFSWSSWRIALFSPTLKQAKVLGLVLGGDIDIANPHISSISKIGNQFEFALTFFLPGEGIKPESQARAGECLARTKFAYP